MTMKLGGYARGSSSIWPDTTGGKLMLLAAILLVHGLVVLWWMTRGADAVRERNEREYVTYYDITPAAPDGTMLEPVEAAVDTVLTATRR